MGGGNRNPLCGSDSVILWHTPIKQRGVFILSGGEGEMESKLLMTPGPTMVPEQVRTAAASPMVNPDIDPDFFSFYDHLCAKLQKIFRTENSIIIMSGEGMLALEAAVLSFIEPGDKVLCLDNGVFGNGFIDLVRSYRGLPVILSKDHRSPFTVAEVEECIRANPDISVATLVHCETPTGLLNTLELIGPVLHRNGIISIVDAVSSLAGIPVLTDAWDLDVVLTASQKCLSATPGLSILSVSHKAWEKLHNRKTPAPGYYMNLAVWKSMWLDQREFPYTQSVSDLYALDAAVSLALEEGDQLFARHRHIGSSTRKALIAAGFHLFPENGAESDTVTAFFKPEDLPDEAFRDHLWHKYGVLIAGTFGPMSGKLWRIGHMGENAREEHIFRLFRAMDRSFADFGFSLSRSLASCFAEVL
jgi:aspartate aminotransferase-like enzyme